MSARSASRTRSRCAGWPTASCPSARREPEAGRDQRRERLDVRAHHQDVAGLERRVVLEQPDQHLAQHVDLACGAVAGVHLQAPVVLGAAAGARAPGPSGRGWRAGRAGASRAGWPARPVGLRLRRRPGSRRSRNVRRSSRASRPSEASSGCPTRSAEVSSSRATTPSRSAQRVPQRGRRLRQVEVYVAVPAERSEQLDLGDRQPGVPEQRQPVRQIEPVSAGARAARRCAGAGRPAGPRGPASAPVARARPASSRSCRVGCPAPSVSRPSRQSRDQGAAAARRTTRRGAASRIGDRVAAVAPQLAGLAVEAVAEVERQRGAPRLAEADRRWSRAGARPAGRGPRRRRARGRAAARPATCGWRNRTPAQTPSPPRAAGAEPVGEPLGQPALDTLGGHHHDLLGERVVQRGRQQLAERVGEQVGPRGAVEVERHRRDLMRRGRRIRTPGAPEPSRSSSASRPPRSRRSPRGCRGTAGSSRRAGATAISAERNCGDARGHAARQPPALRDRPPVGHRARRTRAPPPRR